MKKLIMLSVAIMLVSGCATTIPSVQTKVDDVVTESLAVAAKVNTAASLLVNVAGPLAVTGICMSNPEYCTAAKAGLVTAKATLTELKTLVAAANESQESPDGTKLATFASAILSEMSNINSLIEAYGGEKVDVSELQTLVGN